MKLIKWNLHEDVEAYTTTRKLGDISLNNPNYLKVLENRQELASLLNTDLEHMVAPRQTHSTNLKQVFLMKDGGTNMLKQTDDLYEVDATYTRFILTVISCRLHTNFSLLQRSKNRLCYSFRMAWYS